MNPSPEITPDSEDRNLHQYDAFLQREFELIIDRNPTLSLDQSFYLEFTKMYVKTINLNK